VVKILLINADFSPVKELAQTTFAHNLANKPNPVTCRILHD